MNELDLGHNEATRARALKVIEAVAVMGMTHREAAAYTQLPLTTIGSIMGRDDVKQYVKNMQAANAKKVNVTREQVLEGMLEAIEHAKMVGEPGTEIRGWEAISKMQGYNAPEKHVHDLPDDTKKLLEELRRTDDSRLAELAGSQNLLELTADDYKVSNE